MPAIRPISYRRLINVLEREGFRFDRQKGDHLILGRGRFLEVKQTRNVTPGVTQNQNSSVLRASQILVSCGFDLVETKGFEPSTS